MTEIEFHLGSELSINSILRSLAPKILEFRKKLLLQATDSVLRRELLHRQFISDRRGYEAKLIGWCEVVGNQRDWDVNSIQEAVKLSTKVTLNESRNTNGVGVEDLGFGESARSMRAISIRQPFVEAILRD